MAPTVERVERIYCLSIRSRPDIIRIQAEILCEPSATNKKYKLKREGEVVASFDAEEVKGWWIEDKPAPSKFQPPGSLV